MRTIATSCRAQFLALLVQLVINLARAHQHAVDVGPLRGRSSGMTRWNRPVGTVVQRRDGSRVPQQALGGHHDQRLAPAAQHLPPQAVKILRRRRGIDDLDIVVGRQLQKPFQPGDGMLGPFPSKPCGNSSTSPLSRRHLSSALAMNWSMITWATLTKSPNCASHITSPSGQSRL